APATVSLSSPPRETGAARFNYTKLKRHHPKYKRQRTTFEPRATSTDSRHYDKYKEEDNNEGGGGFGRENDKENHRGEWQTEDEECGDAAVVLESCQRDSNNGNGTNNNNGKPIGAETCAPRLNHQHTLEI
ncbi:hypothetical protein PV326_011535, partial [Microctonus aethiopoides]